jgi:hypothetical protein
MTGFGTDERDRPDMPTQSALPIVPPGAPPPAHGEDAIMPPAPGMGLIKPN